MSSLSEYKTPAGVYAFHRTSPENIASIHEEGINCSERSGYIVSDINKELQNLGYESPFPFDRTTVTYCSVDTDLIEEYWEMVNDVGFAESSVVVVAVEEIDAPMYLADMSYISDLTDYRFGGTEKMIHSDTPEEAVERYRESITAVDSPEEIASYINTQDSYAELIVNGDIPSTAIVDVLRP